MIKVKALIKLYKGENVRKTPFITGYRPLFNFIDEMRKSGQILLINNSKFFPGEQGFVDIEFINNEYMGSNFGIGTKFTFGEGGVPLGEGEITHIY